MPQPDLTTNKQEAARTCFYVYIFQYGIRTSCSANTVCFVLLLTRLVFCMHGALSLRWFCVVLGVLRGEMGDGAMDGAGGVRVKCARKDTRGGCPFSSILFFNKKKNEHTLKAQCFRGKRSTAQCGAFGPCIRAGWPSSPESSTCKWLCAGIPFFVHADRHTKKQRHCYTPGKPRQ